MLNALGYAYTTAQHIQGRIEMFGGLCYVCHHPMQAIDHVIPLAKGGPHWPANLRPICKACNSSKSALRLSEWRGRTWENTYTYEGQVIP